MRAPPLPPAALAAILVAEGYGSLATEILALRRMVPWAGSAVSVTAVLLAVYLAALAGGYRRGGRLARLGDPRPRLATRLSTAAALAAFWLSELGTLTAFGLPVPELTQVAIYSVFGIAPVGWLLAECVPARSRLRPATRRRRDIRRDLRAIHSRKCPGRPPDDLRAAALSRYGGRGARPHRGTHAGRRHRKPPQHPRRGGGGRRGLPCR